MLLLIVFFCSVAVVNWISATFQGLKYESKMMYTSDNHAKSILNGLTETGS